MLPKLSNPVFEIKQPSTGDALMVRPFLVKEEKILLLAKESGDQNDVYNAIKQIINNCVVTEGFDVDTIPIFDMEYIFIKLRAASVSNIVKFKVQDSTDGIEYDLELDLNDVEVQFPENHDKKIMITDDVGIIMKYPTPALSEKLKDAMNEVDVTNSTILASVDLIFDEEETYSWSQSTPQEQTDFIDNLPIDAYKKIQSFFETSPKIEHIVEYTNSEGKVKKVMFRDLSDFFTLG
jgi:hypothetical protein